MCGPHSLAPLKTRYNTGAGLTVNTGAVFGQTSAVSDRCLFAASRLHSARKQWPVRRRRCAEQQTDVNHAVTSCRVLSVDAKPGRLLFSRTCHRTVNTPPSCPGWPTCRLPAAVTFTDGRRGRSSLFLLEVTPRVSRFVPHLDDSHPICPCLLQLSPFLAGASLSFPRRLSNRYLAFPLHVIFVYLLSFSLGVCLATFSMRSIIFNPNVAAFQFPFFHLLVLVCR